MADTKNWWEEKNLDTFLDNISDDELTNKINELSNINTEGLSRKRKKKLESALQSAKDEQTIRRLQKQESAPKPETTSVTKTASASTSTSSNTTTGGNKSSGGGSKTLTKKQVENKLENVAEESQEIADSLNNPELNEKKAEDNENATENRKRWADSIDDNLQYNSPNWFWKEAKEMAPNDKAKQGFLITNHVFNTLGTGLGNIGASVQNNGGSGGAVKKEYGNNYISKYRQSKLDQLLANRKAKQDFTVSSQIDALKEYGASENEIIKVQNRLRNGKFMQKFNRLNNEEQLLLQAILVDDAEGAITDAVLGKMIDNLIEGKEVSPAAAITSVITATAIDNKDNISNIVNNAGNWVTKFLGYETPEMRKNRILQQQ